MKFSISNIVQLLENTINLLATKHLLVLYMNSSIEHGVEFLNING